MPTRKQSSPSCKRAGVRVGVDQRSESVGKKVRDAELGRYPYMVVVGDREQAEGALAVRSHERGGVGRNVGRAVLRDARRST